MSMKISFCPRKSSFSKRKIKLCHPERKRRIFVTKVSRRQRFFVASLLRMTNRDAYILKIDFRVQCAKDRPQNTLAGGLIEIPFH